MNLSSRSISQSNIITKCGNFCFAALWSLLPLQSQRDVQVLIRQMNVLNLRGRKLKSFSLTFLQSLVLTGREVVQVEVIHKTKAFIQSRKVTGRLIAGIFLAGCLAPLSDIFYAFEWLTYFESFRRETIIEGYYYSNYRYLFLSIGPYLFAFFFGLGLSFLFIKGRSNRMLFIPLAIAYPVVKTLWLLQVANHDEFHAIPSHAYWAYGLMLSGCLWALSEYFVYLLNHKVLNTLSTLENITNNRKALPAEQVNEMYATTCTKLKELI
jgi:hypothetical protein